MAVEAGDLNILSEPLSGVEQPWRRSPRRRTCLVPQRRARQWIRSRRGPTGPDQLAVDLVTIGCP
jgi:hypothetical protein